MAVAVSSRLRVSVVGKFFRLGEKKFCVKGVAYGPFAPNAAGQPFASVEQTARDFAQIRELGANLVRIYAVPGKWFLDLAADHGLKVMIDIPWSKDFCFLESAASRQEAREAVRREMQTSTGDIQVYRRFGKIHFEVDGQPAELTIVAGEHRYFLPFVDSMAGIETYPAGRYLEPEPLPGKKFLVDFNLACYNPYCAYNDQWSCPLTPFENRLKVAIRAGEKLPDQDVQHMQQ